MCVYLQKGRLQSCGIFSFFKSIIAAYRSRVPPIMCACTRDSHAAAVNVTLTCTRRSSARRALVALSLSLPLSVCRQIQMERTLGASIRRKDPTSRYSRIQLDAVVERVFFFFFIFFLNTEPCRARQAVSMHSPTYSCPKTCQSVPNVGPGGQMSRRIQRNDGL